mmetsp:Transcript_13048/g.31756  ORF Transcript_13048/g.31756 Transcript_13048/m.31756 type:complete len:668 (-) Transcript_13048:203-2206(-)
MSILLETTLGDIVIDLDVDGSPALCKNILKLTKARYYTNTLIYNIVPGKYGQMGDPTGDGSGGCSIYGLIDSYQSSATAAAGKNKSNNTSPRPQPPDVTQSHRRFLQSHGRTFSPDDLSQKGVVIAMEMGNVPHTIGSQFLFTLSENNGLKDLVALAEADGGNDGKRTQHDPRYLSLGKIAEDSQNVLSKLNRSYCDDDGRPFADVRIQRALVIHDPFDDPAGMEDLLKWRGVTGGEEENSNNSEKNFKEGYPLAPQSPTYDRPLEEKVPVRIQADDTTLFANAGWDDNDASRDYDDEDEEDEAARRKRLELQEKQEEEWRQRQDTSRAVMLEMLGDRPTAEIKAPENVLFVCKLNPLTNDEDLELIFSRFDSEAKAEIIRDPDTGASLQYAFVEFTSNESCNEAYLKMNNALVDDRRIRVDFSQSVAKVWDRYHKKYRMGDRSGIDRGFVDVSRSSGRGPGRGLGPGRGNRGNNSSGRGSQDHRSDRPKGRQQNQAIPRYDRQENEISEFDSFGRMARPRGADETQHNRHSLHQFGGGGRSRSRSSSRDVMTKGRRRRRSRSGSRHMSRGSRRSRSRSDDSSEYNRRKKKHHKSTRSSSRRKRSRSLSGGRSHEQERKDKKRDRQHHRRREYSDEDDSRRERKHHRRHRSEHNDRHRRRGGQSRSR